MNSSTLIELFGQLIFSFTRGVAENYNPDEPEFTTESLGYDPLECTGREWNYLPVDELIYQEYSDMEGSNLNYMAANSLRIRVINACSPEENEVVYDEQYGEDRAMAWKWLRPSALRTVGKSMYVGALISLLTASMIGSLYVLITYLIYKFGIVCEFQKSIPIQVQWLRTGSVIITCAFAYMWYFANILSLFRPHQLNGVKRKLILVCVIVFCLDAIYCIILQVFGISHSPFSTLQKTPLDASFFVSVCWQTYFLTNHLLIRKSRKQRGIIFMQMILPTLSTFILSATMIFLVFPAYNEQNKEGKLSIALFAPLIGVVLKVISRIFAQRLCNITHPGYSYVLLAPLHFASAIAFRILQADLSSVQSMAILGVIHGVAEVIERSTIVFFDHVCHVIWKRKTAPWGSFRTPRRERLMADINIMGMLYESTAVVSVNGFLHLYQLVFLRNYFILELLKSFAIRTSIPLITEWFFTSVSLAIETRYQNMAVMAVWRRRWKKHILVAVVNAVPLALATSSNLIDVVHGRFNESSQVCKMPFAS